MVSIDARLVELGLGLPEQLEPPGGKTLSFPWINIRGTRAFVSGHGPQEADGALAGPFGSVGSDLSLDAAYEAARKVGLSMLGSLRRELGSLDRVRGWCRVHGMVRCSAGFTDTPAVLNGFSDLILDIFGNEIGRHARTAVGVSVLPFDLPVEIEAEVEIHPL